ncbi:MAG: Flp pilus assembly complex ATPase component TadA [Deltaproteobacteria bacterium]|nr:Flp pilus assembly complex ATPase component TadA [Deltaproteobacteria bacterium]
MPNNDPGKPALIEKLPDHPHPEYGQVVKMLLLDSLLTQKQLLYALRIHAKLKTPEPLLVVLKELKYISDAQIQKTVRTHLASIRIGSLLVELGLIKPADLEAGLAIQSTETPKRKLGEVLVAHHFIDERKMIEVLSMQLGFPQMDPEFAEIDRSLLIRVPIQVCWTHNFVPIRRDGNAVLVAFADPLDRRDLDKAREAFQSDIIAAISSKKSILATLEQHNTTGTSRQSAAVPGEASAVAIVDDLILSAITEKNVSDIHIEPMRDRLRIRFRMDGVLVHHKDFPVRLIPAITSRIKILCGANIAEKRRHQGGRIIFNHEGREMDLRVSFYVTIHGEKIVMRLLNRQNEMLKIEDLGMQPRMLERFRTDALDTPSGVLIVTGPTGSGKTTTVYSCINYLNNPETSIITAEEPVEYIVEGIAQCSINPGINLTFEETLRHIVRQDPDVVVIGEIRDTYSAEVAVQAALTGHKVLTTFHTEDSIGGLIRLLNMDIDAFLISSTVLCVAAQRLLRRVCNVCAAPYQPTTADLLRLGYTPQDLAGSAFRKGRGCTDCRHTGYKGRIAIYEILILNEDVRDGLLDHKAGHQIRKISIESTGLVTLLEDGILKAADGVTTVDEVLRCLPRLIKPRPLYEIRRLLGN